MLQRHVIVRRQSQTRPHQIHHGASLREKRIHHRSSIRDQRRLEHVGKYRQHGMERFPILALTVLFDLNALAQFPEDDQIVNEGSRQQGVLARVVHHDGVLPPHEDFGGVLVHRPLRIGHVRYVLDDDDVIGMLVLLEEYAIRCHHVIDDVAFRNLLGTELTRSAEVLTVVITEVIVGNDAHGLNPGGNEEVDHDGLHLGLSRLEIVPGDEHLLLTCQFDNSRHERILRRSVDEGSSLEYTRHGKNGGGTNLRLSHLDAGENVVGGIVDPLLDGREALRVGRPEKNNLIEGIGRLEIANVLANLIHLFLLRPRQDVVRPLSLIRRDKVGKVNGRQGLDILHLRVQLILQIDIEYLGAFHGIPEVGTVDVPSSPDDVVGIEEGEHVVHGSVDGVAGAVVSEFDGGGHEEGTPVVGFLGSFFCFPGEVLFVGKCSGDAGAAIISPETNQHDTRLAYLAFGLELHFRCGRLDDISLDNGGFVAVIGNDSIVGILAGIRFHCEFFIEVLAAAHDGYKCCNIYLIKYYEMVCERIVDLYGSEWRDVRGDDRGVCGRGAVLEVGARRCDDVRGLAIYLLFY
mmetsp:Transcript_23187/g.43878  ORF Transcript_23187/g.43878 Transcript_23187/m.43878 type:complete len:575 (-) Transcript_23187:124-1848(-)